MGSPKKPPKRYITNMSEEFVGDVYISQSDLSRLYVYKAKGYEGNTYVEYTIRCPKCDSVWLKKDAKYANNIQRMKCKNWKCGIRFLFYDTREKFKFYIWITFFMIQTHSAKKVADELGIHTSTVSKYLARALEFFPDGVLVNEIRPAMLEIINEGCEVEELGAESIDGSPHPYDYKSSVNNAARMLWDKIYYEDNYEDPKDLIEDIFKDSCDIGYENYSDDIFDIP